MPYVRKLPSGRWRAEYRDPSGRRHGATFLTRGEARAWGGEQESKVRRRQHVDPRSGRQPFADVAERWWAGRVVEDTTRATNRIRLDKHIIAHWGRYPVEAIVPSSVQAWIRQMEKGGMSAWSIRAVFNLFAGILDAAVADRLIPDNPARGARLPAKPPSRMTVLTEAEVAAVSEAMARREGAAEFDRAVLALLAYTGLRWGEAAGLRRRRLDPMLRHLDVVETLTEVNGRFATKAYPKSKANRRVPIPDNLRDMLAAHLARYPAELDQLVFRPQVLGYRWGRGEALSRHHWSRTAFYPAVKVALKRSDVHIHDLRHSYATWLVALGVPITEVAAILGHASIVTTQQYAHATPERFDRVVEALRQEQLPGLRVIE